MVLSVLKHRWQRCPSYSFTRGPFRKRIESLVEGEEVGVLQPEPFICPVCIHFILKQYLP